LILLDIRPVLVYGYITEILDAVTTKAESDEYKGKRMARSALSRHRLDGTCGG
jgi:hypothetical protein